MFLQVSVCLQGEGVCHSACWEIPLLPWRPPYQGTPLCQGDPPARKTPLPRRPPPPARGPHPRGKLRGSDPGPHPRGKFRGIRSRPTSKGEIQGDQDKPPPSMTTAAGGTHPTGMHSCFPLSFGLDKLA